MQTSTRLALVTGASRGIGQAIAIALAEAGCTVAGTATSASGAKTISNELAERGLQGRGFVADVASQDSIDALLAEVESAFGAPAILVNNAGITRDKVLLRMNPTEWDAVIETNLGSLYRLSRACLKTMIRARWGRIVNISSVVASSGSAGQTNYAASKAGIEGFTRSLAQEVAPRGVTVNGVAPGFIDTDMIRLLPRSRHDELLTRIPLGRLGQPRDVAEVVAFLVSDRAAYITGETVHVNGGMYMG